MRELVKHARACHNALPKSDVALSEAGGSSWPSGISLALAEFAKPEGQTTSPIQENRIAFTAIHAMLENNTFHPYRRPDPYGGDIPLHLMEIDLKIGFKGSILPDDKWRFHAIPGAELRSAMDAWKLKYPDGLTRSEVQRELADLIPKFVMPFPLNSGPVREALDEKDLYPVKQVIRTVTIDFDKVGQISVEVYFDRLSENVSIYLYSFEDPIMNTPFNLRFLGEDIKFEMEFGGRGPEKDLLLMVKTSAFKAQDASIEIELLDPQGNIRITGTKVDDYLHEWLACQYPDQLIS